MTSSVFFDISAGAYIAAMIAYIIYLVSRNKTTGLTASVITIIGFVAQSAAFLVRWINSYYFWVSEHPTSGILESVLRGAPLRNLYESLIFFVWALILAHILIEFKYKIRSLGAFVTPLSLIHI